MRLSIGEIQFRNKGFLVEIYTMAKVSCSLAEVMLFCPLHSQPPSVTRKTAISVFLLALSYTGLLSILAKLQPTIQLAVENEWPKLILA